MSQTTPKVIPSRKGAKNRIQNCLTLKDIYDFSRKDVVPGSKLDMKWPEFKRLAYALLNNYMDHILHDAGEVRLPYRMGLLRIRKFKTRTRKLLRNHKVSNELGKLVLHLNHHTKGYYVRFFWRRKNLIKVTGLRPYSFIPNRNRRAELAKLFAGGQDYFE
jgi:hypothetical protein